MDKNDIVKKIYDSIIDGFELTNNYLYEIGISSSKINELIDDGIIVRVSGEIYHIADVNDLYLYGMDLIKTKDYERSEKCFDICYQMDSKHSGARFQMFLKCIKNDDYNNILKYYDELTENDNKYYLSDTNIYLYLISMVIDLPDRYKNYLDYLKFNDYRVNNDDERFKNILENNRIRGYIIKRKFVYAQSLLNDLVYINHEVTPSNYAIGLLLKKVIKLQLEKNNNIYNLVKERNYEELLDYLDELNNIHGLSVLESKIYSLSENIVNFAENFITTNIHEETAFAAIDAKNYYLARDYANDFVKNSKGNLVNKSFYLVLNDLCEMIRKQENKKLMDNIIGNLLNENFESCFESLNLWIEKNNYEKFRFILFNSINFGPCKNDLSYRDFINTLVSINNNEYNYNLDVYLKSFYLALYNNNYQEANIYLKLIKEGDKFGQHCQFFDGLESIIKYNLDEQKGYSETSKSEIFKDDYFCGIDCIYDIAYKVRTGMDFDEVCSQYNLTEEEKALVVLIFAREYYNQGFSYAGYLFMKKVDEINNKTDRVLKLYNEINDNKTLCQNQSLEKIMTLNLLKKVGE